MVNKFQCAANRNALLRDANAHVLVYDSTVFLFILIFCRVEDGISIQQVLEREIRVIACSLVTMTVERVRGKRIPVFRTLEGPLRL